jgi:uncharacterized membrane protein
MFAVAFIAFGVEQILFGTFVPGRPPAWSSDLSGRVILIYGTALAFIVAGVAIATGRRVGVAATAIAVLVVIGAVARNVSSALADPTFGSAWTRLGKAVALSGGAMIIAGSAGKSGWVGPRLTRALVVIGTIAFAIYLIDSGIQHFLFIDVVQTMVPAWIPHQRLWGYAAGAGLIAGGVGLIVPPATRAAGIAVGTMIFSWFWILHLPRAFTAAPAARHNEWIAVFEALAFAGIAYALTDARRK